MNQPMRIAPVGERWSEWDRFIATDAQATFAHRGDWASLIREEFGHECEYLVAEDEGGRWVGVLPLVHVRGILGHHLVSMPFLNDGGPIGTPQARAALAQWAMRRASESAARSLELRTRTSLPDEPNIESAKVAVHLALPATVDELWSSTFKAKLRSQIRRPSKAGMTARFGIDELRPFYHVFSRNMRDLGTPVLPRRFFERIAGSFGDDVLFTAVYSAEGVVAAASCCLIWKGEMEITWASSVREFNPLAPNMLLYASVMEQAIRRGVRTFNFGRSTVNAPTHRFKQQWGGTDLPLPWFNWPASGPRERPGVVLQTAVAVWRRLPLFIANTVGPRISGQLPW